ncbi:hypothetical protein L2Y96_22210 [Luteibacter aegosomaticola]|uniref:hypothetical protein n=1 Tax=Luteibacter aegosomaticola TaxID=2911538 RepID=UPI001FFAB269|nr:hypothetical protein [Luteibacter aegosomaticola]UPG90058.1 hypothetical protein L2Y96_22210 [Luteibacter aegosomaticola]
MMPLLRFIPVLAFALAAANARAEAVQTDRFFAIQSVEAPAQPEVIVRISENARAKAFVKALHTGKPLRLTSRLVQRPSPWSPHWPFYTERHRLLPIDTLVARCSSHTPNELASRIAAGARVHGSAWCPAVRVVREIRR